MKVTNFTRHALAIRRDLRDMQRDGWVLVDQSNALWSIYLGERWNLRITDVRLAACGRALWVKTEKETQ